MDVTITGLGGLNINLWAGVGMVAVAAAFLVWAKAKPVVVPADDGSEREAGADQPVR